MKLTQNQYLRYIAEVAATVNSQGDYITNLDAATGDGDHWLNLNIGYKKVVESAKDLEDEADFKAMFIGLAKRMMSSMGGTSGALYGSMYLAAAKKMEGVKALDMAGLSEMLSCWASSIAERGNTVPGDKTMLDSVFPAAKELEAAIADGAAESEALDRMQRAARHGAENTKDMEAKRGRASNQAEKGVGHIDAGAVTMAIKLECLAGFIKNNCL